MTTTLQMESRRSANGVEEVSRWRRRWTVRRLLAKEVTEVMTSDRGGAPTAILTITRPATCLVPHEGRSAAHAVNTVIRQVLQAKGESGVEHYH